MIPMEIDCVLLDAYYVNMIQTGFGRLKLAFFDIDGTLVRRDFSGKLSLKSRAFNHALNSVFGLVDIDYTRILGQRMFGLTDRLILKRTLMELGYEDSDYYDRETDLFEAMDEYFDRNYSDAEMAEYYPLPGIRGFLDELGSAKIRLGLVTGNVKRHSLAKLEATGFADYFTTGGFGDDAEDRADIMQIAMQRNGDIRPENICHFGDSPPDLEAAKHNAVKAVAITDKGGGTHSLDELEAVGYGLVIDGWAEVERIRRWVG